MVTENIKNFEFQKNTKEMSVEKYQYRYNLVILMGYKATIFFLA